MRLSELLNSADKWTHTFLARDADGLSVLPQDPKAVCWCLLGAVIKCKIQKFSTFTNVVRKHTKFDSVAMFNDQTTSFEKVQEIIVLFEKEFYGETEPTA